MRGLWLAAALFWAAGPLLAQQPCYRGAGSPLTVVTQLDHPILVTRGDTVQMVVRPHTNPTAPPLGVTVSGIPGFEQIASCEPYKLEWDTGSARPGPYGLRPITLLIGGRQWVGDRVWIEVAEREPLSINPQFGGHSTGSNQLLVSAGPGYQIQSASIFLDNAPLSTLDRFPCSVSLHPWEVAGGEHSVWARGYDAKGREFVTRPVNFAIPEQVRLVEPTEGAALRLRDGQSLTLVAEQQLGEQFASLQFWCDGQRIGQVEGKDPALDWKPSRPLGSGLHSFHAVALDRAGHLYRSRQVIVKVVVDDPLAGDVPEYQQLIKRIEPAVCLLTVERPDQGATAVSMASGFFIRRDGYLITNFHVANGATRITSLLAGQSYPVSVQAVDPEEDLALLRVEGSDFPTLELGGGDQVVVGEPIAVAGFPLGTDMEQLGMGTVACFNQGTINAIRPTVTQGGLTTTRIQFDARINTGNSGGPLFSRRTGKVLGVVRSLIKSNGEMTNIAVAVPVGAVHRMLARARFEDTAERQASNQSVR